MEPPPLAWGTVSRARTTQWETLIRVDACCVACPFGPGSRKIASPGEPDPAPRALRYVRGSTIRASGFTRGSRRRVHSGRGRADELEQRDGAHSARGSGRGPSTGRSGCGGEMPTVPLMTERFRGRERRRRQAFMARGDEWAFRQRSALPAPRSDASGPKPAPIDQVSDEQEVLDLGDRPAAFDRGETVQVGGQVAGFGRLHADGPELPVCGTCRGHGSSRSCGAVRFALDSRTAVRFWLASEDLISHRLHRPIRGENSRTSCSTQVVEVERSEATSRLWLVWQRGRARLGGWDGRRCPEVVGGSDVRVGR